jgi:hypothetical protein
MSRIIRLIIASCCAISDAPANGIVVAGVSGTMIAAAPRGTQT